MKRRRLDDYEPTEIRDITAGAVKDVSKDYKWLPPGYSRQDLINEHLAMVYDALPEFMPSKGELTTYINRVVEFDYKDIWRRETKTHKREAESFGALSYYDGLHNELPAEYQTEETQGKLAEIKDSGAFTKITWSKGAKGVDDDLSDKPMDPLDYKEVEAADIDDGNTEYNDWDEDEHGEVIEAVVKYSLPGRDLGYKSNRCAPGNIGRYNNLEVFKPNHGEWLNGTHPDIGNWENLTIKEKAKSGYVLREPANTETIKKMLCRSTCKNRLNGETERYDLPHAAHEVYRARFSEFYYLNKWKVIDKYKIREIKDKDGNIRGGTKLGGLVNNAKGQLVKPLLDYHVTENEKRAFSIDDYKLTIIPENHAIKTNDEELLKVIASDKKFFLEQKKADMRISCHKPNERYAANFDYLDRDYGSKVKEIKYKVNTKEEYIGVWADLFHNLHRTIQAVNKDDQEALDIVIDINHGIRWLKDDERRAIMLWFQGYKPYDIKKIMKHKSNDKTTGTINKGLINLKKFIENRKLLDRISNNINRGVEEWLDPVYRSEQIKRNQNYVGRIIKAKNPAGKITSYKVIDENDYIIKAKSFAGGYVECFTRNMLEYKKGMIWYEIN